MTRPLALIAVLMLALVTGCAESPRVRVLMAGGALRTANAGFVAALPHIDDAEAINATAGLLDAAESARAAANKATTRPVEIGPDGEPVDVLDGWLDIMDKAVDAALDAWAQLKKQTPAVKQ